MVVLALSVRLHLVVVSLVLAMTAKEIRRSAIAPIGRVALVVNLRRLKRRTFVAASAESESSAA